MGYKFILNSCDRLGFIKSKTLKKCSDQIFNRFSFPCNQSVVCGLFSASFSFQSALWTIVWKDLFKTGSSKASQNIIRLIPARPASGEGPDIEQTCFLRWDVSVRNTNCKDFLYSHEKGRKQLVNVSQMVKLLASLRRGPPIQMAHYFNIWIFILLKHLFFFFFSGFI